MKPISRRRWKLPREGVCSSFYRGTQNSKLRVMTESGERLIVFTRYPEPGRTKTRLIPVLGSDGAADLHRRMTEHTIARVKRLTTTRALAIEVRYQGGNQYSMERWLGHGISFRVQGNGDLGARLERAFRDAFQEGCKRVLVIGTDCPGLTIEILRSAMDALYASDLVLGPAGDGGYYLIGLRRPMSQLFRDVMWGTEHVLARTLEIADELGLSRALLIPLDDVDLPEDLRVWEQESRATREGQ